VTLRARIILPLRRSYHRLRLAPLARAAVTGALFRPGAPDLSHLASYAEEDASGPLQRDEASLLYGAVRAMRPRTIVEVGFYRGRSAFNFLRAMDEDAYLYSFDIDPYAERLADQLFGHDSRFRFALKSQTGITRQDIDGRTIDLLFIDASHDLDLNKQTFDSIERLLSPRALIAVHDTGAWARGHLSEPAAKHVAQHPDNWLSHDCYAHQPGERAFVNWIGETHPDFAQIHVHAHTTLRHGLTLLQAGGPLTV